MMAGRITVGRIAGITAWSAAAVAWGTAAVAFVAASAPATPSANTLVPPSPLAPARASLTDTVTDPSGPLPTLPDTGLVIVRYKPIDRPEPEVLVERRVVAMTTPSVRAPRVKSSGS
ncbi:MAG: hypothetical protein R2823_04325 [Acidimicrobiia bacterium]